MIFKLDVFFSALYEKYFVMTIMQILVFCCFIWKLKTA